MSLNKFFKRLCNYNTVRNYVCLHYGKNDFVIEYESSSCRILSILIFIILITCFQEQFKDTLVSNVGAFLLH